jgi:hypothetical protein
MQWCSCRVKWVGRDGEVSSVTERPQGELGGLGWSDTAVEWPQWDSVQLLQISMTVSSRKKITALYTVI